MGTGKTQDYQESKRTASTLKGVCSKEGQFCVGGNKETLRNNDRFQKSVQVKITGYFVKIDTINDNPHPALITGMIAFHFWWPQSRTCPSFLLPRAFQRVARMGVVARGSSFDRILSMNELHITTTKTILDSTFLFGITSQNASKAQTFRTNLKFHWARLSICTRISSRRLTA